MAKTSIYDFTVTSIDGKPVPLAAYKGKLLLIVNVASRCGLTPQYEGLQKLYEEYNGRGLEVLGFPCNQFRNQEPGTGEDIKKFCSGEYGVTFPLFEKVEVNGEHAHPLYRYLKSRARGFLGLKNVKWNFTKFLVDREGRVLKRFAPTTTPETLRESVAKLL